MLFFESDMYLDDKRGISNCLIASRYRSFSPGNLEIKSLKKGLSFKDIHLSY